ncbi:hypothetical protein PF008_g6370 [Phytophthora fragariae]|uniref:Uncharacterized protein n=1 Tax=Phytophthora fragariae TaxID=53985 RepID=A0A6G0S5M8_9STRA|nr:hypothetical protein PF008_g6370 [Phytophthora fragariae]
MKAALATPTQTAASAFVSVLGTLYCDPVTHTLNSSSTLVQSRTLKSNDEPRNSATVLDI